MKKKIIIYTSEECVFCEAAIKIVIKAMRMLPSDIRPLLYIKNIDESSDILSIPLIKIGELEFSGLPNFDDIKSALFQFIVNDRNLCSLAY